MRDAFAKQLTAMGPLDQRIVLLSGDIGNRMFDKFKDAQPDRFYNCGVAEANMMGMAAGLASSGLRPVVYTITPFVTTRCLEQIRVDVCYHNVPVVIVGTGAGLSYAGLGATHHSCEDIAFLRALPNMTVLAPADAVEVRLALSAAIAHDGPVYMRIGKKGEPIVHETDPPFEIGKAIRIRSGSGVCLLSTGNMLPVVVEAASELAQRGVDAAAYSFHTVKPLDEALLADAVAEYDLIVTVEEHSVIGGFGSAVAEWMSDHPTLRRRASLLRIGVPDVFMHEAGDQEYARRLFGLTSTEIARRSIERLGSGAAAAP